MKKIFISFLFILSGLLTAQIKVKDLPTTTTTASGDFLIKDKAAGTPGSTQKITLGNIFTWGITTYSLQTGSGISGLTTNKYTKATSATTIGDALLFDNGTNVGLGTTTPASKFQVIGTTTSTDVAVTSGVSGRYAYFDSNKLLQAGPLGYDGAYIDLTNDTKIVPRGTSTSFFRLANGLNEFKGGVSGGGYGSLNLTGSGSAGTSSLYITDGSKTVQSQMEVVTSTPSWIVTGSSPFAGIRYAADYSANYTSRSLVDKAYVDGVAGSGITGTGVTGRITKWTGASSIDTSTVLKETSGHLTVTNGSLIKSANGLNYASIGNSSSSLESDNGSGSTASVYSGGTAAGALVNDGVSLVEFYVDAPNNRAIVNTTAGGEITLNSGAGGTIALTTGTVTVNGKAAIIDGNEAVGRVFTCTSGTTGAGTWQAPAGLTGATGDLISFSAPNTQSNISAGAAGTFLRFAGANTLPVVSTLVLPNSATANRLAYATSTNTWGDNSLLTFDGTIFTANALKSNASGLYIGSSAASAVNIAYFKSDQNTATLHRIENASGGTAAIGGFQMHNGTSGFNVYITGTGYTTAGSLVQSSGVVDCLASGGMSISASNASGDLRFNTAGTSTATQRVKITSTGNVILNSTGSALATTATNGFTYIPTCAGTPTGVPATLPTGALPIIIDSTNNKMYIYSGGAWVALN